MPKTIKRRDINRRAPGEAPLEMEAFQEKLTGFMAHRRKTVLQAVIVLLLLAAVAVGSSVYFTSTRNQVKSLEAAGDRSFLYVPQSETEDKDAHLRTAASLYAEAAATGRSPYGAFQLGITHLKLAEYDEAFDAFKSFTETYGSSSLSSLARIHMARIRVLQDKSNEALEILTPAFTDAAGGDTALMLAADILKREGKDDEAQARLRELVERFPGSSWAVEAGARLPTVEPAAPEKAAETTEPEPSESTAEQSPSPAPSAPQEAAPRASE